MQLLEGPPPTAVRSDEAIFTNLQLLGADPAFSRAVAGIREGRFRRDPANADYASRLLYTQALRPYVYDRGLLERILGEPVLKEMFFRTFGYQGPMSFTLYPDCWLRDLPLLRLGERCYLGDGIVLGTNQVSTCQQFITVGSIEIGEDTVIDQQCMVGYGSRIGARCVIGVRVAIGMKVRLGDGCHVAPRASIGHHCRLGAGVAVGHEVFVGSFSIVEEGVVLEDYLKIPQFSRVTREGITPRRERGSTVGIRRGKNG